MNSKKSKTSKPNVMIVKLTDRLDLRRGETSLSLDLFFFCNLVFLLLYH